MLAAASLFALLSRFGTSSTIDDASSVAMTYQVRRPLTLAVCQTHPQSLGMTYVSVAGLQNLDTSFASQQAQTPGPVTLSTCLRLAPVPVSAYVIVVSLTESQNIDSSSSAVTSLMHDVRSVSEVWPTLDLS